MRKTEERKGRIIIGGEEKEVTIIDKRENLGQGNNTSNHDKIEIIYEKKSEK